MADAKALRPLSLFGQVKPEMPGGCLVISVVEETRKQTEEWPRQQECFS
jgi:hypothetical protein